LSHSLYFRRGILQWRCFPFYLGIFFKKILFFFFFLPWGMNFIFFSIF